LSLLLFLVVALAAGAASLVVHRERLISGAIGIAGLVVTSLLATRVGNGDILQVGGVQLLGTDYLRLFLTLGSIVGLLTTLLALATTWSVALPGSWLVVLAGSGLALALSDPIAAAASTTVGALAGVIVTLGPVPTGAGLGVARRELRALVAACVLGIGAAGIASSQSAIALDPAVVGLAFIAFVAGAAIRLGSIPFHLWVARAADTAPSVGLPLVMAWAPAGFVAVTLAWLNTSILPLGESLSVERAVILLVAATTIVIASAVATLHEDLEHIVGYSIVADGAVALLGLAVLDPAAWGLTRTWLITFALAKTGFAAWVAAVHYSYGARQLGELDGWARRSPVLGLALLAVFAASIGLPGMANLDAHLRLVRLALPEPLAAGLLVLSVVSLGYYLRLAITGLRSPGASVASGADPAPRLRRPARTPGSRAARGASRQFATTLAILRENRAPIAAVLVLAVSGLAVIVAAGGFGIEQAAEAARPVPALPVGFNQDNPVSASPEP